MIEKRRYIHSKSDESKKIIEDDKKITKKPISANKERKYFSKAMNVPIPIPKVKETYVGLNFK